VSVEPGCFANVRRATALLSSPRPRSPFMAPPDDTPGDLHGISRIQGALLVQGVSPARYWECGHGLSSIGNGCDASAPRARSWSRASSSSSPEALPEAHHRPRHAGPGDPIPRAMVGILTAPVGRGTPGSRDVALCRRWPSVARQHSRARVLGVQRLRHVRGFVRRLFYRLAEPPGRASRGRFAGRA